MFHGTFFGASLSSSAYLGDQSEKSVATDAIQVFIVVGPMVVSYSAEKRSTPSFFAAALLLPLPHSIRRAFQPAEEHFAVYVSHEALQYSLLLGCYAFVNVRWAVLQYEVEYLHQPFLACS